MNDKAIIIFDGVCNFCNGAVNFIIKRDSRHKFLFTPMQSSLAKKLAGQHKIDNLGKDTFLLIKDGNSYIWTSAALEIANELDGYWYLFRVFRIIPRPVRDIVYRAFARNRYALFGRTEACMIPSQDVKDRFIGVDHLPN